MAAFGWQRHLSAVRLAGWAQPRRQSRLNLPRLLLRPSVGGDSVADFLEDRRQRRLPQVDESDVFNKASLILQR